MQFKVRDDGGEKPEVLLSPLSDVPGKHPCGTLCAMKGERGSSKRWLLWTIPELTGLDAVAKLGCVSVLLLVTANGSACFFFILKIESGT